MTPFVIDLIAVIITLMVLSRIVADNPVFRATQYLFIGVSLGYAFVVVYHQVLLPAGLQTVNNLDQPIFVALRGIPLLLGFLFLPRIIGRQVGSWLADIPLSLIFGVGAAVAFGGALAGTLIPQVLDTAHIATTGTPAELAGTVVLAIGVVMVLSYFYFTAGNRGGLLRISAVSARMGRWVLMVTFGVFLAGALLTYLTALSDRLEFLATWVQGLFA